MAVEVLRHPPGFKSTGATASLANGEATTCASLELEPGRWLLVATCRVKANATGHRALKISADEGDVAEASQGYDRRAALAGAMTPLTAVAFVTAGTYRMNEWQDSGSTLATYGAFRAVRLG